VRGVEVAHALHRYQERFIGGEPRVDQDRYLLAQVVSSSATSTEWIACRRPEVAPPSGDLLLERYRVDPDRHRSGSLWKWRG
jgi:hypothetical protein